MAYTPANAPAVVVSAGAVPAAGPAVGTIVAPPANPAVGTIVAPGPAVPTTVAPSPYNSSYPPTAGGVVQGHATQPPPYAAAPTGAVVQGYATPPPQAAQAVGTTVAPPPYSASPPPQAVAEVQMVQDCSLLPGGLTRRHGGYLVG